MSSRTRPSLSHHHLLVTGGTGYLGRHIIDAFLEQHPEVKVTALDLVNSHRWPNVNFVAADITNATEVSATIERTKPTIIIHTAGIVPDITDRYKSSIKDKVFRINVQGADNVLVAAKKLGVRYFVLTGSVTAVTDDIYHDYPNYVEDACELGNKLVYGTSKKKAEQLVLGANNPPHLYTCSLRPCPVFGAGADSVLPTISHCIPKHETPFIIGPAFNLYDFVYVTNVADAHVLAVENLLTNKTAAGHSFSITNQQPIPFRDFCKAIWAAFGHIPPFEIRVPASVGMAIGLIAEWVTAWTGTQGTISRGSVKDYVQTAYADCTKAREILGYVPRVALAEGVKIAAEDFRRRLAKAERERQEEEQANSQLRWKT